MAYFRAQAPRIAIALLVIFAVAIFIPLLTRITMSGHLYADPQGMPHADAALVPGASVVRGEPSGILAARADTAIVLYQEGRVDRILVTGDSGERNYDEVTPVLKYLLAAGIPSSDIFLDSAGFDTYSSMYRARFVFGARSLIVVTQDFHLPRAVFLARMFGIDANGLVAPGGDAFGYLREIPASLKAILDFIAHREPKYLGAPWPLGGKGNVAVQ